VGRGSKMQIRYARACAKNLWQRFGEILFAIKNHKSNIEKIFVPVKGLLKKCKITGIVRKF
jgi:hypothetical protein